MTTLLWIIASCVLGGALSIAAAPAVAFRVSPSRVPILISYAVGAFLGAVYLEILPHAFEAIALPKTVGATVRRPAWLHNAQHPSGMDPIAAAVRCGQYDLRGGSRPDSRTAPTA
jgi:hypothetical protein